MQFYSYNPDSELYDYLVCMIIFYFKTEINNIQMIPIELKIKPLRQDYTGE